MGYNVMSNEEMVKEFLIESNENLTRLDQEMVELEQNPDNIALLSSIFRTIHTIKGTCVFFGFSKLESLTHIGENLLSRLRDRCLQLTPEITSGLLSMVDAIRQILFSIEIEGKEIDTDFSELIERLTKLNKEQTTNKEPKSLNQQPESYNKDPQILSQQLELSSKDSQVLSKDSEPSNKELQNPKETRRSVVPSNKTEALSDFVSSNNKTEILQMLSGFNLDIEQANRSNSTFYTESTQETIDLNKLQTENRSLTQVLSENTRNTQNLSDNSIRVDVSLLDKLMNLVGELVLARNQILQFTATQSDSAFIATSQRLNLITSELQEGVMKTRMQPIANIWNKFPRVVRDLAVLCGKQVHIEMEGKETELDKTIIEAIKDPLTHILRNAIDHGIELPQVRQALGKSPEGCIFLRASHEGGQVNIEISDDGGGINSEQVKQKALKNGLITPEQAACISEREATNLIFLPGFSTSEKITNVSGRGVGMDVVKTNIEKIGGLVDVQSKLGNGTTIKIKIPLTLAIIPALIVTTAQERYAIPQISLLELVRLESDSTNLGIELIHNTPFYRLRGNLLPLVYLNRELMLNEANLSHKSNAINIVVLQADERSFGLVVDEINDTEEIVVKPLSKHLKGISCFAGATIMGDGKVALILDVLGIAQNANVISEVRDRALTDKLTKPLEHSEHSEHSENYQTLLLFRVGKTGRIAMPLSMVARLEEFPSTSIETAMDEEVIQYRGQILRLIRLSKLLYPNAPSLPEQEVIEVIVYAEQDHSIGFVVDSIIDIVEENLVIQHRSHRQGILGSAIIHQHVTDILDVHNIIDRVDPHCFEPVISNKDISYVSM
jgi:two-component system chemotaxis sensor kinase CheA